MRDPQPLVRVTTSRLSDAADPPVRTCACGRTAPPGRDAGWTVDPRSPERDRCPDWPGCERRTAR